MEELYLCIPLIGCLSVLEQFYAGLALVFIGGAVVGGMAVWLVRRLRESGAADRILRDHSGNVFFTLFGAVAIVGVIGASTMQIANGPVRTMAEVTKRTVAENNMIAGARLAIITSTTLQAASGDCDADGFVEPFPSRNPGGAAAPSGGGLLPNEVAVSKQDPWGNEYGYCVWDHGSLSVSDDVAGCGGSGARRLEGGNLNTQYSLALISSGPDRVFQTSCNDWVDVAPADGEPDVPLIAKVSGSDDLVLGHTYAEASALGAGLWTLKEGAPDTAAIEKDLEVTGGMELSGSLNLLSQGLVLPGDPGDDSITGACSPANDQQLRRNTSTSPPTIEICDLAGSGDWEAARGSGLWKSSGSDIYYDDGNVGIGTTNPTALLEIASPGSGSALEIGRASGQPSIQSTNGYLIMDSGGAAAGLNWYSPDRVILANGGGNVGIGETNPSAALDISATGDGTKILRLGIERDWCFYQRNSGGSTYLSLESDCGGSNYKQLRIITSLLDVFGPIRSNDNITAAAFLYSSDRRLKEKVETLRGLDLVRQLRGVSFDWKGSGRHATGLIAQEVELVLPHAVVTDDAGMKAVDYLQLIGPMIEAIKELEAQNDALGAELRRLSTPQGEVP